MDTVSYTIVHPDTKQKEEIRFSKTDSIKKVLNAACKAFKIRPENHELRYAQRKLESNMNLMFSDLPDGVFLELCTASVPDGNLELVTVNLIIGDGTVNTGKFRKTATLWDVYQGLLPKDKFFEDDRICVSLMSKCFNGPAVLKRVPLSSLKLGEDPLNLSLTRKYSKENLSDGNDTDSLRRNCKTFNASLSSGISNEAGTSKASSYRHNSTKKPKDAMNNYSVKERKNKSNVAIKRNLKRKTTYRPEIYRSRLLGNTLHFTDQGNDTMVEKKLTTNLTAKAAIDKHFYLTPEKKLNDLKYLNSRQGIAYVNKQPIGEILREESAVDLLDLGRDSTRSIDGSIEIKLFLPDETAIQAMFRCEETVEDVFRFINPLLQCQPSDYFLYVSNPTESLKKNISLNELEESSGVNFYLSLNPKVKKIWPKCKPFLKEEHLPKKGS